MADCIVPGCPRSAENNLSIRLRKPDTTAYWSPETKAHICDTHARSGARISVTYEATETGRIDIIVQGATEPIVRRSRAIRA